MLHDSMWKACKAPSRTARHDLAQSAQLQATLALLTAITVLLKVIAQGANHNWTAGELAPRWFRTLGEDCKYS